MGQCVFVLNPRVIFDSDKYPKDCLTSTITPKYSCPCVASRFDERLSNLGPKYNHKREINRDQHGRTAQCQFDPPREPVTSFAERCQYDEEECDDAEIESLGTMNVDAGPEPADESYGEIEFACVALGVETVP